MCERVIERNRFEIWTKKTGKSIHHWNQRPQNKEKPYPSDFLRLQDLQQWILDYNVLQIILGPTAHIEIIKRSGPVLKLLCRTNEMLFDESIVELVWLCQVGKREEMVRTIYNLIQEILPVLPLPMIDLFFEKVKNMTPSQIDEKYVVFLREFTKTALNKRFVQLHKEFTNYNQPDNDVPFFTSIRDSERGNIAELTSSNAAALIAKLEEKTHDYGLRLFWHIIQDNQTGGKDIVNFCGL